MAVAGSFRLLVMVLLTLDMNCQLTNTSLYQTGLKIVETLQKAGFKALFVGGYVRDMLLGYNPSDIDIVTSALPDQVIRLFPSSHDVGASFGVITVVENDCVFEVATFREEREYNDGRHPESVQYTDDPKLDAMRRDFTINGMFYDPVKEKILDYVGGEKDLKRGILRTIGNAQERFDEDYLRMLRAVRFCARFNLTLDPEIKDATLNLAACVKNLSPERIRDELNKMFTGTNPEQALQLMSDNGLLAVVLPEIEAMKGVPQPKKFHPEGDVFTHVRLMLSHMSVKTVKLAWCILMHDVAKPLTLTVDERGVEHFYTHEKQGAEMAKVILERFRFPRDTINSVVHVVGNHMRLASARKMKESRKRRMIADPDFPLDLELHRIDCVCSHRRLENYLFLLDQLVLLDNEIKLPEPLIKGQDLLGMGMKPGPQVGQILKAVMDMQLEGEVNNREEALLKAKEIKEENQQ